MQQFTRRKKIRTWQKFFGKKKNLVLNLPPYSPELNPIELIFQLLGYRLRHLNTRFLSHQMKSDDFFLLMSVEVLEPISDKDVLKSYKNAGTKFNNSRLEY